MAQKSLCPLMNLHLSFDMFSPGLFVFNRAKKSNRRAYLYDGNYYTAEEICEMIGVSRKKFSRLLFDYNGDVQRMMDIKLGKVNFD